MLHDASSQKPNDDGPACPERLLLITLPCDLLVAILDSIVSLETRCAFARINFDLSRIMNRTRTIGQLGRTSRLSKMGKEKVCRLVASGAATDASSGSLRLVRQRMDDADADALATALSASSGSIRNLDLGSNWIGDKGAFSLSAALCRSQIAVLTLRMNSLSFRGAYWLSLAMRQSTVLQDVSLHGNGIGDSGAGRFGD